MRAISVLAILPILAACEREPTPVPEPPQVDPVVVKTETERRDHLQGAARPGDFKVNFGEPFIGFENRGNRMAIRQNYEGPSFRVVEISRSGDEYEWVFRGKEGAVPGDEPFVLTIVRGPCSDPFTGERTNHTAWLGTASQMRKTRSCAAPAR